MAFYIQTQPWPRCRYRISDRFVTYRTIGDAQAEIDDLRRIGSTIPMRIVNERLEIQKPPTSIKKRGS